MKKGRLILFVELVNGCNNSGCPSWGGVCKYDGMNFMEEATLEKNLSEVCDVLKNNHPFERVDVWPYGCGDSMEHPNFLKMLKNTKDIIGDYGKISLAVDSRREPLPIGWDINLDKVKIIHKIPESFDWVYRAEIWNECITKKSSHKLITNTLSINIWNSWKKENFIKELKAVPFHTIQLGTENPQFIQRDMFTVENGVPVKEEQYQGLPVRRAMIRWDGTLRRCLVSPTKYKTVHDILLMQDDVCNICFPLTGSQLAKFYNDYISITPAASCVSDGYFRPDWF